MVIVKVMKTSFFPRDKNFFKISTCLVFVPNSIYRIYSSERPGRSFNMSSQRGRLFEGGALSKKALIKYIKKTSKYF